MWFPLDLENFNIQGYSSGISDIFIKINISYLTGENLEMIAQAGLRIEEGGVIY